MPEKDQFLMPQNTQNIAPVQAGTLFSPEPRTTKKWQKWCQMVPKSDAEPSKRPSGNMFEIALKYPTKKNKNVSKGPPNGTPKRHQNHQKMSLGAHLDPPWPPNPAQGAPQSHFARFWVTFCLFFGVARCNQKATLAHFGTHFPYFGGWKSQQKSLKLCNVSLHRWNHETINQWNPWINDSR